MFPIRFAGAFKASVKKFPRPVALHFLGRKTWNFDIGLMYHEREKFSGASEIYLSSIP